MSGEKNDVHLTECHLHHPTFGCLVTHESRKASKITEIKMVNKIIIVIAFIISSINDLVYLVPFFGFDHNMQQSGTAVTQYDVVFCYLLKLSQ